MDDTTTTTTTATEIDRVRARAEAWLGSDPDPAMRAALQTLLDDPDGHDALVEHVDGSLEFGTAGLRGVVGPGPLRMNRAVVIRTTRGLADHLIATVPDVRTRPVVVGFDARTDSETFARDTVGVLLAAGLTVAWFPEPAPTPAVAFAGLQLDAAAAVVITASHNPPEYNGYKVYATNGAQIVPPDDIDIAAAIDAVGPAADVGLTTDFVTDRDVEGLGSYARRRYLEAIEGARPRLDLARDLTIAYTPLHGVGGRYVIEALERAGYHDVHPVAEQFAPDGAFPTVAFPNPEEPGALDLAFATAERVGADLILANDPDADRLAVAVPSPEGGWLALSGNQIGLLLADHLLACRAGDPGSVGDPLVLSSIVSSPALRTVAAHHGARYEPTLTGFKWICNAALEIEQAGGEVFVFGYEEALGYSVGRVVRDKDGISAAVAFADLVSLLAEAGEDVLDRLAHLARRDGLWVSHQTSIVRPGTAGAQEITDAMARVGPGLAPERLGGRAVAGVTDYRTGGAARPRWLPDNPLVELALEGGSRVLIRPSGTEPKLKIYVDLRDDLASGESLLSEQRRLATEAAAIAEDLARFVGLRR